MGVSCASPGAPHRLLGPRRLLELSWASLGVVFSLSWGCFGPLLGLSWTSLSDVLGFTWGSLGAVGVVLGLCLGRL